AVLYTLILSMIYKEVKWKDLPDILIKTVGITAMVMLLVGTSMGLSWVMSFENIPQEVSSGLVSISDNPPGSRPTRTFAKSIRRTAIPPRFISCPASMKNGIASKAKLSRAVAICCESVVNAGIRSILIIIVSVADNPILYAIGTPIARRRIKLMTSTAIPVYSMFYIFSDLAFSKKINVLLTA
ncbi:unnamed protein product, partial [marine sediment metagenome]